MDTPRPSAERLSELTEAERARAHELIERIRACDAAIARAEGEKAAHLAELASIAADDGSRSSSPDGPEQARRAMAAEVAAATRQHPATAGAQLGEAQQLVDDYPATHEALREGRISRRHASVIAEAGAHLSGAQRAVLDETSVPLAERRTPGELRRPRRRPTSSTRAARAHRSRRSRRACRSRSRRRSSRGPAGMGPRRGTTPRGSTRERSSRP